MSYNQVDPVLETLQQLSQTALLEWLDFGIVTLKECDSMCFLNKDFGLPLRLSHRFEKRYGVKLQVALKTYQEEKKQAFSGKDNELELVDMTMFESVTQVTTEEALDSDTVAKLKEYATTDRKAFEELVVEKQILVSAFKNLKDDQGVLLVDRLRRHDIKFFDRLIDAELLTVNELHDLTFMATATKGDKSFKVHQSFLFLLLDEDLSVIDKWLDQKKTDVYALAAMTSCEGVGPFHYLAKKDPKELTRLVEKYSIDPKYIGFLKLYSALVWLLLMKNEEEFLDWVVKKKWIGPEDSSCMVDHFHKQYDKNLRTLVQVH